MRCVVDDWRLTDHGGRPCEMRMVFFLILRSRLLGPRILPSTSVVEGEVEDVSMIA